MNPPQLVKKITDDGRTVALLYPPGIGNATPLVEMTVDELKALVHQAKLLFPETR